jgi:1,5-anhydro-D-fructose reductase (1,5-anhydro-D-mannitol-forming)
MVRWGIVGFGLHAVRRLMPGFQLSKNCRVTALSRRDQVKAHEAAKRYQIPHVFASAADLGRSPEVDAVLVTTPNSAHLDDVLACVAAGKPVLCEKPMGMNAGECRRMVEAAHQAGVLLGVAQVFRFDQSVTRLWELVAGGQIGTPVFARAEFSFMAGPKHGRTWIYDPKISGGGPIADIGVHCIDTLRYILQDEVVRVSARGVPHRTASGVTDPDIEDAGALTLEFSRGTLGTVLCSYLADYRSPIELVGTSGVLHADDCLNVETPVLLELRRGGETIETETVSNTLAYALQADAFAAAVEGKADFLVPGEEGWQNQEILDAAYRSLRSGKAEDVPRVK